MQLPTLLCNTLTPVSEELDFLFKYDPEEIILIREMQELEEKLFLLCYVTGLPKLKALLEKHRDEYTYRTASLAWDDSTSVWMTGIDGTNRRHWVGREGYILKAALSELENCSTLQNS